MLTLLQGDTHDKSRSLPNIVLNTYSNRAIHKVSQEGMKAWVWSFFEKQFITNLVARHTL